MPDQETASRRRQEASRRNGALSRGPVTPEGKARASRNAVKHGCAAILLTFTPAEAEQYEIKRAAYLARFQPRDQVEHDLVEQIVRSNWQMHQCWIWERSILHSQELDDVEHVDAEWEGLTPHDRHALSLQSSLRHGSAIPNLQRYQRSYALQAERAIKLLQQLQKQPLPPLGEPDRKPAEAAVQNEPIPITGHHAGGAPTPEVEPATDSGPHRERPEKSAVVVLPPHESRDKPAELAPEPRYTEENSPPPSGNS